MGLVTVSGFKEKSLKQSCQVRKLRVVKETLQRHVRESAYREETNEEERNKWNVPNERARKSLKCPVVGTKVHCIIWVPNSKIRTCFLQISPESKSSNVFLSGKNSFTKPKTMKSLHFLCQLHLWRNWSWKRTNASLGDALDTVLFPKVFQSILTLHCITNFIIS